jgi:arylsulfatase A-like enzyme
MSLVFSVRKSKATRVGVWGAMTLLYLVVASVVHAESPPNIVYIMSDELAYYELGHMGNPRIRTPRIDQFAREGLRLTNALAGSPVCAPLRCTLMTGKHSGHASVRANDGGTPLRAGELTIASLLKQKGYATGGFGKWGCGGRDSTGVPEEHGFDIFYGYYDQVHAHSFYPPYLIRNSDEVVLDGNSGGRKGQTYSHYKIMDQALDFIEANKDQPFFCYLPITPPHGMYDIPEDDPAWELYRNDAWVQDPNISQDVKNYAAMVSMVDRNVGEVLDLLRELGLEENTIVFFTGDNGGQDRFKSQEHPRGFFGPNVHPKTGVEFRGGKGNLYEGGLKIPFLVRWPDHIEAGRVSDLVFYQPDLLPTLTELTAAETPSDIDGISILPEILGEKATGRPQKPHDFLYWEFGNQVAVRQGDWKAIRPGTNRPWELYDLATDVSEAINVAADHQDRVTEMVKLAEASHTPVDAGVYLDQQRTRHERDRQAKWGTSGGNPNSGPTPAHRLSGKDLLPFKEMRVHSVSSESTGNNRLAKHAIDGDPKTVWHTAFAEKIQKHPHQVVVDLGASRSIKGVRYLARQDRGWNGAIAQFEIYLSDDPEQASSPVAQGTWKKSRQPQEVMFEKPQSGRYLTLRALSEVNQGPWASAADIGVIVGEFK